MVMSYAAKENQHTQLRSGGVRVGTQVHLPPKRMFLSFILCNTTLGLDFVFLLVWLLWGDDNGRRRYERRSDPMAKVSALTQRESLQPRVVAVTVTSKKVRSLLVLGAGKQFISSFSGNR